MVDVGRGGVKGDLQVSQGLLGRGMIRSRVGKERGERALPTLILLRTHLFLLFLPSFLPSFLPPPPLFFSPFLLQVYGEFNLHREGEALREFALTSIAQDPKFRVVKVKHHSPRCLVEEVRKK